MSKRIESEAVASLNKAKISGKKALAHVRKISVIAAENELKQAEYYATDTDYECSVDEAECWILTSKIEGELLRRYDRGICCFSTTYSNPLLWSY